MRSKALLAGLSALVSCGCLALGMPARADTTLYISNESGDIGQVDINTQSVVAGSVHNTGQTLTDIGFNSSGTLYGTTFTNLYSIDPSTGAASDLGAYGTESGMNALVGSGGTNLYGASFNDGRIYNINPSAPASPSVLTTVGANSAGDLAYVGSTLYEAAVSASGADELLNVTGNSAVGLFHVGSASGATVNSAFGIADDGTTLYAVAGTEVYSVDPATAVLTPLFDYSLNENGQDLGPVSGAAFIGEGSSSPSGGSPSGGPSTSVPEPASIVLLGAGLAGSALMRRRHKAG